ncbi:MAG: PAS domain-containing protein [Bacteroidales bacterium]|nr:PAS domain-containing protein [Bacteroidales bacterium]
MVLNRFSILVFAQIILIATVGMLIAISFRAEFLKMTTVGLMMLWAGQILFLNFYMNRIHRDVRKFMEGLRSQDTSQFFNDQKADRYFGKLYSSFNEITRNFRLVRIEKEVENQFFREALKCSASGMMAVTEDGKISLINDAALQILGVESLNKLSELREIHPGFAETVAAGDVSDHQVKIVADRKMVQLAVKASEMHLEGTPVKIYSLLDITREMDRSEVEAWQKLIRVLNHEITNSVVPLHLLSTSLFDLFHDGEAQKSAKEIDDEVIDRTVLGLRTMIKRSGGLTDFINTYKSFTDIGEPDCSTIRVSEMLNHIVSLLSDELDHAGVKLTLEVSPSGLQLLADEKLIEQTLINLVKNSIFALEGVKSPEIQCKAFSSGDRVSIEVTDNGRGIPEEILDNIFTPFFTTRKEGSGIGLSLARQVMQMHDGSIRVSSAQGEHTTFTLSF